MLYVTTRNHNDAFTAYRALTNEYAPDGGSFVPFHLPVFSQDELSQLKDKSFNEIVAEILNMFFSLRLNGLELDLSVGKNMIRVAPMNHRIVIAELWHNLNGMLAHTEDVLCKRLAEQANTEIATGWSAVAVKIAVIFGIYGHLLREGLLKTSELVDVSVRNDEFKTPMALFYCRKMGLPVNMIVCTCDDNGNLWDLIHRGTMSTVGISLQLKAGLERLLQGTLGCETAVRFSEAADKGRAFSVSEERLPLLNKGLFCSVAGKDRAQTVINSLYRTNSYIIDSNAALCYGGLQDYRAKTGDSELTVILAETSPLNCVDVISAATGLDVQIIKNHIN